MTSWFFNVQMRVSTRYHQDDTGERKRWILQPGGGDVALKMADADHRNIQGISQRLCIVDSDEESASQAWSLGDGDSREIGPCETGLLQRFR